MRKVFTDSTDIVFIFSSLFLISLKGNVNDNENYRRPLSCVKVCMGYISSKVEDDSCITVIFSDKIHQRRMQGVATAANAASQKSSH